MQPAAVQRREIATRYEAFAEIEAAGRSELYARIARAIAIDRRTLELLAAMEPIKRQPNLLLGVVRYLYGTPSGPARFLDVVHEHAAEIAAEMAVRSTQTNEPARCATLLPALARLPQPLALIEAGAAAGLCLLPDHYGYDYGSTRIAPSVTCGSQAPVFRCRASADTPLPDGNVEVAWRAGLDRSPIELTDDSQVRWLEALVWPGEEYRLPLLRDAIEIARSARPRVLRGDLRYDLPALAAQAPSEATLVVFHSAVLAYVADPADRERFGRTVGELGAVWIANEGPEVIPGIAAQKPPPGDAFLMSVDGRPIAWADGHATWIDWFPTA